MLREWDNCKTTDLIWVGIATLDNTIPLVSLNLAYQVCAVLLAFAFDRATRRRQSLHIVVSYVSRFSLVYASAVRAEDRLI